MTPPRWPGRPDGLVVVLVALGCFLLPLYSGWSPRLLWLVLVAVPLTVAALLARSRPLLAGALIWVGAFLVLNVGYPSFGALIAVTWVLHAAARYGSPLTASLAGLSIPAGGILTLTYLSSNRPDNWLFQALYLPGGLSRPLAIACALVALVLPWALGLVQRARDSADRARAAAVEAERLRLTAESARAQAQIQEQRQARKASQEASNAQLARDVHDVVGHSLAIILAQAEAAQYQASTEELHTTMNNISTSARRSLREIREILGRARAGDHRADAPDGGIVALIQSVQASGAPLEVRQEGRAAPLPPEIEPISYRVLQEMLTNALRHGRRGEPMVLTLTWADRLRMEVRNIASDEVTARLDGLSGSGLQGIRNRLAQIGGSFEFERFERTGGDLVTATAWVPRRAMGEPR